MGLFRKANKQAMGLLRRANKAAHLLMTPRFRKGLAQGVAATIEHEGALGGLCARTVVDVGANKGQFSLFALEIFPKARVWAFEPLAEPRRKYLSVLENEPRAHIFSTGIGPKSEEAVMHVSNRDDSSSLLPITATQTALFPSTYAVGEECVSIAPLSNFLSESEISGPALLKIDVQGYEKEVLKGCSDLLRKFDFVYVECSFIELYQGQALACDVIDILHKNKYKLMGIYNTHFRRNGRAIQADFLFQNTGKSDVIKY